MGASSGSKQQLAGVPGQPFGWREKEREANRDVREGLFDLHSHVQHSQKNLGLRPRISRRISWSALEVSRSESKPTVRIWLLNFQLFRMLS